MRKTITIVLSLLLMAALYAAIPFPYIRQYQSCFTVDLASNKFLSHNADSAFELNMNADSSGKRQNGSYYYMQELGVFGINGIHGTNGIEGNITLTVELTSGDWFYRLAGSEYKRPYGIDIFARGRRNNADELIAKYTMQLGNQAKGTWGLNEIDPIEILASDVAPYDNIWWDMCLVLDPDVDSIDDCVRYQQNVYDLMPSENSYTADLTITLSYQYKKNGGGLESVEMVFPIHLEGYYKPTFIKDSTSVIASLNISKSVHADNLRLDDSGGDLGLVSKANGEFTTVANYSLSTSSVSSVGGANDARKISIFLSSSNSGFSGGNIFSLHHVKDPNGESVSPLVYEVAMESTSGKGHNSEASDSDPESVKKTVIFDGTDVFNFSGGTLHTKRMIIDATAEKQKTSSYYSFWNDEGTIGIRLTGNHLNGNPININSLPSGEYTSTIYVHVITF